jgi:hypothetical protein
MPYKRTVERSRVQMAYSYRPPSKISKVRARQSTPDADCRDLPSPVPQTICVGAKLRSASGARQLPTTRHTSRAPPLYRSPDGVQASLSRSPPAADAIAPPSAVSLQVPYRLPSGCLQVACRLPAGCLQVAFRLPSGVVLRRFFGQGVGRQDDALEQAPHLIAAEARPGPRAVQRYTKWARPGRAVQ